LFTKTNEISKGLSPELVANSAIATKVSDLVDVNILNQQYQHATSEAVNKTDRKSYKDGVNFFGNAEAYNFAVSFYGPNSPEASAALQVLRNDMATLILEEVSLKNYFSANYDIKNGKAYAAGTWLGEQYARTIVTGQDAPAWMQERFLAETEEQLSLELLIASSEMNGRTMVTLSPSPFGLSKELLGRYDMERNFLMIRFLSLDETGTKLNISQIQIPQELITEEDLLTFLESLDVEPNASECIDGATNILRSSFLIDSGSLGSRANILRALDLHISERAGHPVYCGQKTDIQPNSQQYDKFIVDSIRRYSRFESAINYAVNKITEQAMHDGGKSLEDVKRLSRDIKERALSLMNDKEIRLNYGDKIANAYQSGGYEAARSAGLKDNFSSGSCPSSSRSNENGSKADNNSSFCQRLPKPGEVACCPGCKKTVVVTGTEDNIRCSNGECALADRKSRAAYLAAKIATEQFSKKKNNNLKSVWKEYGIGAIFFVREEVSVEEYRKLNMQAEESQQPQESERQYKDMLAAKQDQFALAA
jgi:hypothetical protein